MRSSVAVSIMVALGLLAAGGAFAQGNPFNPLARLKLSNEDMAAAGAAADALYQAGAVGKTSEWANATSGNAGTVKLLETFEYEGYPCRSVEHVVKTARNLDPSTLVIKSCQVEDGSWKLI